MCEFSELHTDQQMSASRRLDVSSAEHSRTKKLLQQAAGKFKVISWHRRQNYCAMHTWLHLFILTKFAHKNNLIFNCKSMPVHTANKPNKRIAILFLSVNSRIINSVEL
jgi:hypothetical protein